MQRLWVQIFYRPDFFFRPYLHYCLSSVHFWGDHFHIQFVLLLLCNIQIFLFRLEIVENDEGKNILEHPDYFEVHKLFTLKDLFNANVHLGHNEGCWDPLMKPYLFGVREKHHIIDLNQTVVHLRVCTCIMQIKGLSFQRNCGAAWVGEYNRVIKYYQLSWLHKVASKQSSKANVSSIHHCSDEGLMLEISAMLSFTGANFCY